MSCSRRDFVVGSAALAGLSAVGATSYREIKAVLLHLGYNMWYPSDTELRAKDDLWRKAIDGAVKSGMNMVVVDVGEGIVLPSHPELAIKGSWSPDKMKDEIKRLNGLGLEVVPKLNFSATHDAWLKDYARMVSTQKYYEVVKDVIRDVSEIFGSPRLFHLGWDEETAGHQSKYDYVVVRSEQLWWHDFLHTIRCCEETGSRPWIWSDFGWHHKDFVKRCPKTVMQSNWYYDESCEGFDLSKKDMKASRDYLQLYLDLDKHGFDQIPCGTNWVSGYRRSKGLKADEVIGNLVKFSRENISADKLRGFLTAAWAALDTEENLNKNLAAMNLLDTAMKG